MRYRSDQRGPWASTRCRIAATPPPPMHAPQVGKRGCGYSDLYFKPHLDRRYSVKYFSDIMSQNDGFLLVHGNTSIFVPVATPLAPGFLQCRWPTSAGPWRIETDQAQPG